MSNANHYRPNLRDAHFNLFEFLDIERTSLGKPPFADFDGDTARESLRALEEL